MRLSQFSSGSLSHKRGGQISSGSLRQSAEVLAASAKCSMGQSARRLLAKGPLMLSGTMGRLLGTGGI